MLFKASQPEWADKTGEDFITDGPFMFRGEKLYMLWSSIRNGDYVQAVSFSENGKLRGRWYHDALLFEKDGGHGMIFNTLEGETMLSLHRPNNYPDERPVFFRVLEKNGRLYIEKESEKHCE